MMHHFGISYAEFSSLQLIDSNLSHRLLWGEEHVNSGMADGNGTEEINKSNRTHYTMERQEQPAVKGKILFFAGGKGKDT
jgi:hypothetical protein